jgi:primosomal protein N' (replication factor Y)
VPPTNEALPALIPGLEPPVGKARYAGLVEVAVPRGPAGLLTYAIPWSLAGRVHVGGRLLVPLGRGNRRLTGYAVGVSDAIPDDLGFQLKPVADVLDPRPLFSADMLALFRFIATYYFAPLGDVIRGGLPTAFNLADARVARLTPLGAASAVLHPLLTRIGGAGVKVKDLDVPQQALVKLAAEGLLTLDYELQRPVVQARWASVVAAVVDALPPGIRADGAPARVFELVRAEGPLEQAELKDRVSGASAAVRRLLEVGAVAITKRQVFRDPWRGAVAAYEPVPTLTPAQTAAVGAISGASGYQGFLLFGVTGSGKTEVYLESLRHALEAGKTGLVLVPEIALTPQLAARFRGRFGDAVAVLHSGLSDGERLDQWQLIRDGKLTVVVGARSALFAPLQNVGLIVVDEEHESSFKQDEAPRYHARDLALFRGRQVGCPVVLGSATPSLESWHNAERGRLTRIDLPGRIGGRGMPPVELVDVEVFPYVEPSAMLTQPLLDALKDTLERREQAILFLNRRGFSASFQCAECETVVECPSCTVALTFHRAQRRLTCHYCGHAQRLPERCPTCLSLLLEHQGTGTEQVEAVLRTVLPTARVARMDRDTTRGHALTELLDAFRAHEIDVLIGTQMVAKGHDFPKVTLVGVLQAEHSLGVPDFRAAERTFQLLTQVAGRAGRAELAGRVLLQTAYGDHYALQAALNHDFLRFITEEERRRRRLGNPPYGFLVLLRLDGASASEVAEAAGLVTRSCRDAIAQRPFDVSVVGPTLAPIERIRGRTRYLVLLKSRSRTELHGLVSLLAPSLFMIAGDVRAHIDVDPLNLS